jgi:glycosyltransferase involved in cell wall biosynthesis
MKRIAWVTTWSRVCGIADYSQALWPAVSSRLAEAGYDAVLVSLDEFRSHEALLARLRELAPSAVHFQHEYGIWGGKNPPFYGFPSLVRSLRAELAQTRLTATAHTVIGKGYRFPVNGRGWQAPLRWAANQFLLKRLSRSWAERTWGALDGVIVHSRLQSGDVQVAGCRRVQVIPHFVPSLAVKGTVSRASAAPPVARDPSVLVFGFFTPEKGQDVAIEAFSRITTPKSRLVLAGGVRRPADRAYQARCLELADRLKIAGRIEVTGFVEKRMIDQVYSKATLVLAPFRETTGSGSLAQAFARGAAVLASDLPLNREIAERTQGALEFFKAGDPSDCARQMERILADGQLRERMRSASVAYAESCSPARVADQHVEFFREVLI